MEIIHPPGQGKQILVLVGGALTELFYNVLQVVVEKLDQRGKSSICKHKKLHRDLEVSNGLLHEQLTSLMYS